MGFDYLYRVLRRQLKAISHEAHRDLVNSAKLADFTDSLDKANEQGITKDDIEWLRVIAGVQARLDECQSADEFGLPHGNWREWDIPFEKTREFYSRMRASRAVQEVHWSIGGHADVSATDLRAIQRFLALQLKQRLRSMNMLAAEPGLRRRKVGHWLAEHATALIIGVAILVGAGLILAYLGLRSP